MSAADLLTNASWVLYLALFLTTADRALRRRRRADLDIALFFGDAAVVIVVSGVAAAVGVKNTATVTQLTSVLVMLLPYLLLRLVADFGDVPALLMRVVEAGLGVSVVVLVALGPALPGWVVVGMLSYFLVVIFYASLAFVAEARRTAGVTRRRMQAVALGSWFVGLDILVVGLGALLPAARESWGLLTALLGLASAVAYGIGFAPPKWIRRAWQAPALRAFLGDGAALAQLPDSASLVRALEQRVAGVFGIPSAGVSLWSERGDDVLHFSDRNVLAAPVTTARRRFGVLVVHPPRASMFADSDIVLVQLLADQIATTIETRALLEQAALVLAREHADGLKDDLLASISHDLRNPLTVIRGNAELLQLRIARSGTVEPERLRDCMASIEGATVQMTRLIDGLLDYGRLQMDRPLELIVCATDIVALTRKAVTENRAATDHHDIVLSCIEEEILGRWDPDRLERVLQNLLGNALKYSPDGGNIEVRVWRERTTDWDAALVSISDHGIGIPPRDLPDIFERFRRAANVIGKIAGTGIGLAVSRQIVEQHGGSISVESEEGRGSTFVVRLPIHAVSRSSTRAA
jgi:signal transduction histidine kinase